MELRTQVANLISRSLLFSLSRQYLDKPLSLTQNIQPIPPPDRIIVEEPRFLRIEQIGCSFDKPFEHALTALQTTLSACHSPEQYTLIFLLTSDGLKNNIYLGVSGHGSSQYPTSDFLRNVGQFLQGNWPGTRAVLCDEEDAEFDKDVTYPLHHSLRHAVALTGIPSEKHSDETTYPQSLDRFLRGFRGIPHMYMVIAEPMTTDDVDTIVNSCRDQIGQIHALTKITQTLGHTTEGSTSTGWSMDRSEERSISITDVKDSKDWLTPLGSAAEAALRFSPLKFAVVLKAASNMLGKSNLDKQHPGTITETNSNTTNFGVSGTTTIGSSTSESFGQENINAHAQAAEIHLQQFLHRFEQSRSLGCWNVGVYLLANRPDVAQQGGSQLRALLTGEKSAFEPIRVHDLKRVWASCAKDTLRYFQQPNLGLVRENNQAKEKFTLSDLVEHPLGSHFSGLTTPLNTEELALLINLPRCEVPGVPTVPTANFGLNVATPQQSDVILGCLLDRGNTTPIKYSVSRKTLAKHTLITGMASSGKSTTSLRLLSQLHEHNLPFLIIEPTGKEYVEWALNINATHLQDSSNKIAIYMPGAQSFRGHKLNHNLYLNPLDIVWPYKEFYPRILSHIDRLKLILDTTFSIQESLQFILEEILFTMYSRLNWLEIQLPEFDAPRPTLKNLYESVQEVIEQKAHEQFITATSAAALMTHLQSLRRGWKGQVFDQQKSTPWSELFDQPVVINLSLLGSDNDCAFIMSILLKFLYEYRQAQFDFHGLPSKTSEIKHLTVIEEAHRIFSDDYIGITERTKTQNRASEILSRILLEIGAYGEGLIMIDQIPSRLTSSAIQNSNLKIVHRLTSDSDCKEIGGYMGLSPTQTALIKRLRAGQAVVHSGQDDMAVLLQIDT